MSHSQAGVAWEWDWRQSRALVIQSNIVTCELCTHQFLSWHAVPPDSLVLLDAQKWSHCVPTACAGTLSVHGQFPAKKSGHFILCISPECVCVCVWTCAHTCVHELLSDSSFGLPVREESSLVPPVLFSTHLECCSNIGEVGNASTDDQNFACRNTHQVYHEGYHLKTLRNWTVELWLQDFLQAQETPQR